MNRGETIQLFIQFQIQVCFFIVRDHAAKKILTIPVDGEPPSWSAGNRIYCHWKSRNFILRWRIVPVIWSDTNSNIHKKVLWSRLWSNPQIKPHWIWTLIKLTWPVISHQTGLLELRRDNISEITSPDITRAPNQTRLLKRTHFFCLKHDFFISTFLYM